MAYQDITPASAVLNREIAMTRSFFARVGDWFARVADKMAKASAGQQRFNEVQKLSAMTDEEFAKKGIKRDEIVHHVFRDLFYI